MLFRSVQINRELGSRYSVVIAKVSGRDLVGFVEEAKQKVGSAVQLPTGYRISWGGQFENQQRAAARLGLIVPLALGIIFMILFSTFGSVRQALLVLSNVPFALVGGIWLMWFLGFNTSVAVAVGFIALAGVAAETGVIMLIYLDQALLEARAKAAAESRAFSRGDLNTGTVVCHALCQFANNAIQRCREQQCLTLWRALSGHGRNVVKETHVEHAIGFIQNQDLYLGEVGHF